MTRAGRIILLAAVMGLFSAGIFGAILSERRISNTVPGRAPIRSLAVIDDGFLVGTEEGVYASRNGREWAPHPSLPAEAAQVATVGDLALVTMVRSLFQLSAITKIAQTITLPGEATAIGGTGEGAFAALADSSIFRVSDLTTVAMRSPHPREVFAISAFEGEPPAIYTGSPSSGVWESVDGGRTWLRILETPSTAILGDPENPSRILLGTPGGLLMSTNDGRSWRFTGMRGPISGISFLSGTYYVISDRLVWSSEDGDSEWKALG